MLDNNSESDQPQDLQQPNTNIQVDTIQVDNAISFSNSESDQPQDLQQLNTNILVANAISYSLLFSLRRQYLSIPLQEAKYIQLILPKGVNPGQPYLLQVEQVGNSMAGSLNQPFTTLQTALSTCHNPGRYALVSIISSDGRQNRIYLGLRSPHTMDEDVTKTLYYAHLVR